MLGRMGIEIVVPVVVSLLVGALLCFVFLGRLRDTFEATAARALHANGEAFLARARVELERLQETATGDLTVRQAEIGATLQPIREQLDRFEKSVRELETKRASAYADIARQVQTLNSAQGELRTETANLASALRQPGARGRWGELTLKRVVETSGLVEHCDFVVQPCSTGEDGRLTPDLLVRLPGGKNVVVDSKAPLASYLAASEAKDEATREARMKEHAQAVRRHVEKLAEKAYWARFQPSPELVVMFLPGEAFFSGALSHDPDLIAWATERNVVVASPTTLICLLRAVACGWRQENVERNAEKLSALGRELYKRIGDLAEHFSEVGKGIDAAARGYNKAVGTLESRVLVSARKLQSFGASSGELPEPKAVESVTRPLTAPELFLRQ